MISPGGFAKMISPRIAMHYRVVPLSADNSSIQLACGQELPLSVKDELKTILGRAIQFVVRPQKEIEDLLAREYGVSAGIIDILTESKDILQKNESEIIDAASEDATISKLVNDLLADGIDYGASDIHIEPFDQALRIRYRVDGLLVEARFARQIQLLKDNLISRIKIMANLDISEKRLPQDGRIKIKIKGEEIDLRVSVLPSAHGEAVVIRILKPVKLIKLEELGFSDDAIQFFSRVIKKPNGIILVTGPTGSGKTTTLYACLQILNEVARKIVTIEDPVEYKFSGVLQMQVNSKIDFTFANALRSILRHDPDVIMVGEIRDVETAEIAIRAALTGHLVLSTLHTNDAASAVARLIEMGIESYLISSSLLGVVSQRLVRKLCAECTGAGGDCKRCRGNGYKGRTVISEQISIDDELAQLIVSRAPVSVFKDAAASKGFKNLASDGVEKISAGITDRNEVLRLVN